MFPGKISVSTLAIYQQTATSIQETIDQITRESSSVNKNLHHIESLYDGLKPQHSIPDGKLSYPNPESSTGKGMAISVRYALNLFNINTYQRS